MTREYTSCPTSSCPNQYRLEGPGQQESGRWLKSTSVGKYRAISGAKIPTTMNVRTKIEPTIAPGFRRSRCQASRHSPPVGALSASSVDSISAMLICDPPSREPDPGIEDCVRDVHEQVHEDEHDREEEHAPLDHGVVAIEDRVRDPAADDWIGEHGLRQHDPREQQAGLQADDRRDGRHRVPQDVAAVDERRRQAFRAGSTYVVLVLDVE